LTFVNPDSSVASSKYSVKTLVTVAAWALVAVTSSAASANR